MSTGSAGATPQMAISKHVLSLSMPGLPPLLSLAAKKALLQQAISRWQKSLPDPRCELYYETPYQLLVSVVLSAQTTDAMVNRCMRPLYAQGFNPETVVRWGEAKLLSYIRSIGLAPTKAKNVVALSKRIIGEFAGEIPRSRKELESLPGVGRKTANVILGELFGEPTLAVDTHVFRVTQRLGLQRAKTPEKAEQELLKVVSPAHLPKLHHWFIHHGRYTCKAAKPLCGECVLVDLCKSPDKNLL
jgi:endonuclease-3